MSIPLTLPFPSEHLFLFSSPAPLFLGVFGDHHPAVVSADTTNVFRNVEDFLLLVDIAGHGY